LSFNTEELAVSQSPVREIIQGPETIDLVETIPFTGVGKVKDGTPPL
jgi:hypothetical protein